MKYYQLIFFFLLVVFFISCNKETKIDYHYQGLSFSLAEEWEILSIDTSDTQFLYFFAEKSGPGQSKDIIIESNSGYFDLDTVINTRISDYKNHEKLKDKIQFRDIKTIVINQMELKTIQYRYPGVGFYYLGTMYCFYLKSCDKTLFIVEEQVEDKKNSNEEEVLKLIQSFQCSI